MTILLTLLGFTFIIFVHELGHFLVARWAGVRVEVFSIGIGPRFITLYRDKRGTEYILSMLPLGGYVKMHGQQDLPTAASLKDASKDSYQSKPPKKRLAIILAGVVMNVIFAYFFIVLAFSLGVPFSTNKIGDVLASSKAESAGILPGDVITKVGNENTETFEELFVAIALAPKENPLAITINRENNILQKNIVFNPNNESELLSIGVTPYPNATVGKLEKNSNAYKAGLRKGMPIISATYAGETLANPLPWQSQTFRTANGIARLITKNPNSPLKFTVQDGEETKEIIATTGSIKQTNPAFQRSAKVAVVKNYPAQKAGLQDGDLILSINSVPMRGFEDIVSFLEAMPQNSNAPLEVSVQRGNSKLQLAVIPVWSATRESYFLGIRPITMQLAQSEENSSSANGTEINWVHSAMLEQVPGLRVGDALISYKEIEGGATVTVLRENKEITFSYAFSSFPEDTLGQLMPITAGEKVVRYSFIGSLKNAFPQAAQELREVYLFLTKLVTGEMSASNAAGPIAIFETSSIIFNEKGFAYFLLLFAKISISLAVTNLLPIPMLDGGHAVFIVYEMIRGKPAPENLVYALHMAGFALLIFLIIFVNYNDIMRIINR